jgi:quinol monooxygenase YgiN
VDTLRDTARPFRLCRRRLAPRLRDCEDGGVLTIDATRNKGEEVMAIRLVVTITARPGTGSELAAAYQARCSEVMQEKGCEEFEVFQSLLDPDKLVVLERWSEEAALDAHARLNRTRPPLRPDLRLGGGEREDYTYNRTR